MCAEIKSKKINPFPMKLNYDTGSDPICKSKMEKILGEKTCSESKRKQISQIVKLGLNSRCLLAYDLDKTLLSHTPNERAEFSTEIFGPLKDLNDHGLNLCAVSANSSKEIINRYMLFIISEICRFNDNNLDMIENHHIFFNGAGTHIHFKEKLNKLKVILPFTKPNKIRETICENIFYKKSNGELCFKPRFVDEHYAKLTQIELNHQNILIDILRKITNLYIKDFISDYKKGKYNQYFIVDKSVISDREYQNLRNNATQKNRLVFDIFNSSNEFSKPFVEKREIEYLNNQKYCSQITLKPILSEFHYKGDNPKSSPRDIIIKKIQKEIQEHSELNGKYCVRAGGTTSIDISKIGIDKQFALEYLIKELKLYPSELSKPIGSNTIYIGDEVCNKGYDIPATKVEGITVLAVNPDKHQVPFQTNVIVDNRFIGPEASSEWIRRIRRVSKDLIQNCMENPKLIRKYIKNNYNLVAKFKVRLFRKLFFNISNQIKQLKEFESINLALNLPTSFALLNLTLNSKKSDYFTKFFEDIINKPKYTLRDVGLNI